MGPSSLPPVPKPVSPSLALVHTGPSAFWCPKNEAPLCPVPGRARLHREIQERGADLRCQWPPGLGSQETLLCRRDAWTGGDRATFGAGLFPLQTICPLSPQAFLCRGNRPHAVQQSLWPCPASLSLWGYPVKDRHHLIPSFCSSACNLKERALGVLAGIQPRLAL